MAMTMLPRWETIYYLASSVTLYRVDPGKTQEKMAYTSRKKLLIDFLYAKSGGHLTYVGRYMLTTHKDMEIVKKDRVSFPNHLKATLDHFQVTEKIDKQGVSFY